MAIPLGTLTAQALLLGEGTAAIKASANFTLDSTESYLSSSTQPRVILANSGSESVPSAAWTSLTWDTENVNVGSMHSTVTNSSRVTIQTGGAGLYLFLGTAQFGGAVGTATQENVRFLKNGASVLGQFVFPPSLNGNYCGFALANLVATDFVEMQVFQDSGANMNILVAAFPSYFAVKLW